MQTQWLPTALHQWWAEVQQYSILGKIVVTVIASGIVAILITAVGGARENR